MKRLVFISVVISIISACDPDMVYDTFQKTKKNEWTWEDKKVFEVDIADSLRTYNIILNIRHTKEYPKSNLFVFVTTQSPQGQQIRDTLEIRIADERGKWQGSGFGDIKLVSRMYRRNVMFRTSGKYIFTIEQGMRLPAIPVTDVGLRVEKFNSNL